MKIALSKAFLYLKNALNTYGGSMSFIGRLAENETGEDGRVRLTLRGRRVTGEIVDLVFLDGRAYAIVAQVDPPHHEVLARHYQLNDWKHATVPPLEDPELEKIVLELYRHKLSSAA